MMLVLDVLVVITEEEDSVTDEPKEIRGKQTVKMVYFLEAHSWYWQW